MIYESIPDIAINAVRSIYRPEFIDIQSYSLSRLSEFIQTNVHVAAISSMLSALSFVVSVVFVLIIVFIAVRMRELKAGQNSSAVQPVQSDEVVPAGALRNKWDGIVAHLDSPRESDWKIALLEADTLVDDALSKAGFAGETFGDRLSNIHPGTLLSLDGVWWAHKVRNRLAHETDYFLRYTEARQALGYYKATLAELHLI